MSQFRAIPAVVHVLGTVVRNIGPAIRMSWPWLAIYAIVQAIGLLLFPDLQKVFAGEEDALKNAEPGTGIMLLTLLLLSTVAFSSLAVNWHRFMLLGEEAEGEERLRMDGLVFRYIGNAMLGGLIGGGLSLLALIPVMILGFAWSRELGLVTVAVLSAVVYLGIFMLFQRLFLKLPAIALGRDDYGFRDALADSGGNNMRIAGFIIALSVIMLIAVVVTALPLAYLIIIKGEGSTAMALFGWTVQLVLNWLGWIVGINALTTLYGIFAEGREV